MNDDLYLHSLLIKYQSFINSAWDIVFADINDNDLQDDWLEANWELIVESQLQAGDKRVNISRYGSGASGNSDRIFIENAPVTHDVKCFPSGSDSLYDLIDRVEVDVPENGFTFRRFVTVDNDWYYQQAPFNLVQVCELENAVFILDQLKFKLLAS
ncbi:hypothetical protein Sbal195_2032 [Shewanella baltica OS195]|uniref:Uncharacterized protein n=1 Tax=Shewanella baltica (strain OS195) TaxID=399599 RepID=A9KZV0_SHEB9|nr:hypothetical protein [Shewanella baltica]ABX49202.1 hypothetical protein Sbal195_2032 [Shewanella baltica OS195]ADT94192.1 hypothetical protein Sbal678_2031 [Shewanella baltica OS678]